MKPTRISSIDKIDLQAAVHISKKSHSMGGIVQARIDIEEFITRFFESGEQL